MLFSIMIAPIYISTKSEEGSAFSTFSPAFIVYRFFDDGYSDKCEMILHCSFDLHFSNNQPGFPGGSVVKNPPANAGDVGSIPESGRSPREGNGNSLQFTCLGNPRTEEPGSLQSMGSQRIVHDLVSKEQFLKMH